MNMRPSMPVEYDEKRYSIEIFRTKTAHIMMRPTIVQTPYKSNFLYVNFRSHPKVITIEMRENTSLILVNRRNG